MTSESALCDEMIFSSLSGLSHLVNSTKNKSAQAAVVTSVTPDIVPKYAGYSLALNAIYTEHWGFAYHAYSEDKHTSLVLDADPRWNKVLFLLKTMQTNSYEYVIWMDADLVVLDFSLDLLDIARQHSGADIIMSKDKASAPFVGNTGLMIIRCTAWSIDFLQRWWSSYDRSRCCDQHALTWLMQEEQSRQRIVFLPTPLIGSDFPIWTQFRDDDPVLHLAGLTSLVRKEVFSFAWRHVCVSMLLQEHHPDKAIRVPVTKEYLWGVLVKLDRMRIEALQDLQRDIRDVSGTSSDPKDATALLLKYRKETLDIIKADDDEKNFAYDQPTKLALVEVQVEVYLLLFDQLFASIAASSASDDQRIPLYVDLVSVGFELLICSESAPWLDDKAAVVHRLEGIVVGSVLSVAGLGDRVYARFQYYLFKLRQLSAKIAKIDRQDALEEERLLSLSVAEWRQLRLRYGEHYRGGYVNAEPEREYLETLVVLGTRYCSQGRYEDGVELLEEASSLQEDVLARLDVVRIVTTDDELRSKLLHAEIQYNAGLCLANHLADLLGSDAWSLHQGESVETSRRKAVDYLEKSLAVFTSCPNPASYASVISTIKKTLAQLDQVLVMHNDSIIQQEGSGIASVKKRKFRKKARL